ncbi:hypothetical protein AAAC51_33490 [Priestia megaterium]
MLSSLTTSEAIVASVLALVVIAVSIIFLPLLLWLLFDEKESAAWLITESMQMESKKLRWIFSFFTEK